MPALSKKRPERPAHMYQTKLHDINEQENELIRKLVLEHKRIDVLCKYVLDATMEPPFWFHMELMEFQQKNPESLILAFRGSRKTSYLTIARAIFEILLNPNVRILFAADATDQAKTFLRGVKAHFERNEKLREIFGDYITGAPKWADGEIIVNRRRSFAKEPTISTCGSETTLPGRHYDVIIADDLVTEENSSTPGQREKIKNFYYKTLLPCLEPEGKMWVIGTRWNEEDLYGWLAKNDYEGSTFVFGILDETTDESVWEEKFATKRMHRIRKGNLAAFELQWMCRSGVGMGGIFNEHHFEEYTVLPDSVFKWQGVDLAIGQKNHNDFFAHVTIAISKVTKEVYLLAFREAKMQFPAQVRFIASRFNDFPDAVRVGIEANAYQIALTQQVKHDYPDIPVCPIYTLKDKVARAQQLAQIATDKPIKVLPQHHKFVRRLCSFPNGPKDLFDAFDIAVSMGLRGVRKKRRDREPGLL